MTDAAHEAAMRAARAIVPKVGVTGAIDADEKRRKSVEAVAALILTQTGLAECVEALAHIAAHACDHTGSDAYCRTCVAQAALALVRQGPGKEEKRG